MHSFSAGVEKWRVGVEGWVGVKRLHLGADRLRLLNRQPPGDALSHTVLDHLAAETADHPVRNWLV